MIEVVIRDPCGLERKGLLAVLSALILPLSERLGLIPDQEKTRFEIFLSAGIPYKKKRRFPVEACCFVNYDKEGEEGHVQAAIYFARDLRSCKFNVSDQALEEPLADEFECETTELVKKLVPMLAGTVARKVTGADAGDE